MDVTVKHNSCKVQGHEKRRVSPDEFYWKEHPALQFVLWKWILFNVPTCTHALRAIRGVAVRVVLSSSACGKMNWLQWNCIKNCVMMRPVKEIVLHWLRPHNNRVPYVLESIACSVTHSLQLELIAIFSEGILESQDANGWWDAWWRTIPEKEISPSFSICSAMLQQKEPHSSNSSLSGQKPSLLLQYLVKCIFAKRRASPDW